MLICSSSRKFMDNIYKINHKYPLTTYTHLVGEMKMPSFFCSHFSDLSFFCCFDFFFFLHMHALLKMHIKLTNPDTHIEVSGISISVEFYSNSVS